jgi:hypothetical protein
LSEIDFGALILVTYTLNEPSVLGKGGLDPTIRKLIDSLPGNTNVAIASAITAYSRMIINTYKLEAIKMGLEIYYSDTDSLVLNGPLPEKFIDSATLGKLKLEHVIKEGIFVMPKVYYLEDEDGSIVSKAKGYSGKLNSFRFNRCRFINPPFIFSFKCSTISPSPRNFLGS